MVEYIVYKYIVYKCIVYKCIVYKCIVYSVIWDAAMVPRTALRVTSWAFYHFHWEKNYCHNIYKQKLKGLQNNLSK